MWWLYKVWNGLITSMAIQYTLEGKSFNYFFGWSNCCYDTKIIFPMNKKVHDPSMPPTESHFSPQKTDKLCHAALKTITINPNIYSILYDSLQTHDQRGTFNGIVTCNITIFHYFSLWLKWSTYEESLTLLN